MSSYTPPDPATTAITASRAHGLQTVEQLLEHCAPDDIPDVITGLRLKLAHHRRTLNSQQSSLLSKLPPELIIEIGECLLEIDSSEQFWPIWHDKSWFRAVLPLMQTCTQLRANLRPLLSKSLTCLVWVRGERIWDEAIQALEKWRKQTPHKGRVTLIVSFASGSRGLELSTAAAFAGALECAIHGKLSGRPNVYVQCMLDFVPNVQDPHINHKREVYSFDDILTLAWEPSGTSARRNQA